MGRRWRFWPPDGLSYGGGAGYLGPLRVQVERRGAAGGVFCAVNESVWEHMKLLFFPVFLFTAAQFCVGGRTACWRPGRSALRQDWP